MEQRTRITVAMVLTCTMLSAQASAQTALVVDGFSCERAAACSGRNEICASCSYGTYAQCAAACLSESTCVSFEWASEGGAYPLTCHLSTSCMAGVSGYYGPGESYSNWNLCVRTGPVCNEALSGSADSGYRGCQTRTRSGAVCQRWDSQSPNIHSRTPENHPSFNLTSNYCRNPDGEFDGEDTTIWCYTQDGPRWEYCNPLSGSGSDGYGSGSSSDDDDPFPFATVVIVATVVPICILLMVVAFCFCFWLPSHNQHARRNVNPPPFQLSPMQRVTPSAQPAPMALPAVIMSDPVPMWTPPTPAASTAMSSGAPPSYAAYVGAPATGATDMFNTDGTFK